MDKAVIENFNDVVEDDLSTMYYNGPCGSDSLTGRIDGNTAINIIIAIPEAK
ncbi:MAG: hypothetical protein LBH18_01885 [Spirochaetaceae bacterium]|nr:hypothetical protein [Spirochaetaceae bacterium]